MSGDTPNVTHRPAAAKTTRDRVLELVRWQLGLADDHQLDDNTRIEDLGADCLDQVELVMAVEEAFRIEISDPDAEELQEKGLGHWIAYIDTRLAVPALPDDALREHARRLLKEVVRGDRYVRVLDQGEVTRGADGRAFVAAIVEVPVELLRRS